MKMCPRCDQEKLSADFYKNRRKADGLQSHCKACHNALTKVSYENRREHYLETKKQANRTRRKKRRQILNDAKAAPCADCRKTYPPYVMDFDHVRGKKLFNLGTSPDRPLREIKAEIQKCEVVCANCHRVRTHKRGTAL